jgi:cell division protein FtsZ
VLGGETTLLDAFRSANQVLQGAVQGIAELITRPGLINVDFADVRTVMSEMGNALMGTGFGTGDEKSTDAARQAISSPLLEDVEIGGAQGVLINVTGGHDMTLFDVNTATSLIYEEAGCDANIIFGAVIDPEMENQMRVTVIATGIGECENSQTIMQKPQVEVIPTKPAKPMSLFPDHAVVLPQQSRPLAQPASADPAMMNKTDESDQLPTFSENPRISGSNGGSNVVRNRVPMFSEDDLTIPAYIRRLDEDN